MAIKLFLRTAMIVMMFVLATPAWSAAEQVGEEWNAVSLRWENDAFGGTDENYTNGMSLALATAGGGLLGGVWDIGGKREGKRSATYELSQLVFTPSNLHLTIPDPSDRPYAGILYLGLGTHLQQEESLHTLKLIAGVVGPVSMGKAAQTFTHGVLGYTLPEGWDYQIKNEPVINLLYEYRRKLTLTPPETAVGIEIIPLAGGMLGNYLTQAQIAGQLRVGYNLPDDFGPTVLRGAGFLPVSGGGRAGHGWGFYAFAGGGGSLVLRNITLDGNTFADSRHVERRPLLPEAQFGASLCLSRLQMTFSYVMMGMEFYGQKVREDYGSVIISYLFH